MSLMYLTPEQLESLALTEEERQTVEHYHRVLAHREILPMVHPSLTDEMGLPLVVPTIIPPRTTKIVTDLIDAIRTMAGQILKINSNWCECSRQYMLLENGKAEWIKRWLDGEDDPETGKPISKTRMERKLEEIDRTIQKMFRGDIPVQWATDIHEPPCQHCGKHRLVDQVMAYSEPGFIRNLLNIFLGGEFPLDALPLFLEYVDRTVFNEDVIPPTKKKRVMEVEAKVNLIKLKDKILKWVPSRLTMLEEEDAAMHTRKIELLENPPAEQHPQTEPTPENENSPPDKSMPSPLNTSQDSMNTTEESGDGPPNRLTGGLLPPNEISTTTKPSKPAENSPMN